MPRSETQHTFVDSAVSMIGNCMHRSAFAASSRRPVFVCLLLLSAFPRPLSCSSSSPTPFSVSVRCSAHSMELFVQFREPFHGRLKTRPNGLCFVNGRGRNRVGLRLPLDEDHRQKCAIVKRNTEYVAIIDLEMNSNVMTAEDNAYFVRCPIGTTEKDETEEGEKKKWEEKPTTPDSTSRKVTSSTTMALPRESAGEMRSWQEAEEMLRLRLELDRRDGHAFPLRLRKCAAFSSPLDGLRPVVRAVQISDEYGCPISANSSPLSDQSELLFREPKFKNEQQQNGGGTGHFFIQCEVLMNHGEREEMPCHRTSASPDSAVHPQQRLSFPPSDPSSNEPSSDDHSSPVSPRPGHSPSSPSSLLGSLSFLSVFVSVFLIFCSLGFICFISWHCPNGFRRVNASKWKKPSRRKTTASCSAATASVTPSSSAAVGIVSLSGGQCSPMASPPLAFFGCLPSIDDASPPPASSSPALSSVDFATSLDCLPEPPSLTLDEVRQLNDAFNGIKMGKAATKPPTADDHQCQQNVYSFAGIRLNSDRNGKDVMEKR